MIIRWRNKFSGEEGYVKRLCMKEQHFENTFNRAEAANYRNVNLVLTNLLKMDETINNEFFVEEV